MAATASAARSRVLIAGLGAVCGTKALSFCLDSDRTGLKGNGRIASFSFFQNYLNGTVAYCDTSTTANESVRDSPSFSNQKFSDMQKNMEAMLDGSALRYDPETGEDSEAVELDQEDGDSYGIGDENISDYIRQQIDDDEGTSPTLSKDWDKSTIFREVDYLIVGAGVAAQAAVSNIAKLDPAANVLIVGEKAMADDREDSPGAQCAPFMNSSVGYEFGRRSSATVVDINIDKQVAMLSDGKVVRYKESVLLASGTKEHHHLAPVDIRARKLVWH